MPQPIVIETFAADTGQFTVTAGGSYFSGTFAITGGQGVFNSVAAGNIFVTAAADTANMPVLADALFVYVNIGTPSWPIPAAGIYTNIAPGIFKGTADQIMFEFGTTSNPTIFNFDILLFVGGAQYNLGASSIPISPIPDAIGASLQGNIVKGWARFGSTWQLLATQDVSLIHDYSAPGALVGFSAGVGFVQGNSSGTMAVTELWSGPPIDTVVPNVVGESIATASANIVAASLVVGTITPAVDPTAPGTITAQFPVGGSSAFIGDAVDLTESLGLPVPSIVGLSPVDAAPIIVGAGFVVGTASQVVSTIVPPGFIVSQNPLEGSFAAGSTPVSFAVSIGPLIPGVIPNFLDDEAIGGGYFGGVLNLVEFAYLPERTPFLEGATNLIINRYKQEPGDNRQRGVDYHYFLVPGETIQTLAVTGISAQDVLQANTVPLVTPLVVSNLLLDPSGTKFAYSVSGGQNGVEYTVQFVTTTQIQTSNIEEIFSINILVEDSFP